MFKVFYFYVMRPEKVAVIVFSAFGLIALWLFRKRVSYWLSPATIIGDGIKKMAFGVHFFSTLMMACCVHGVLIHLFHIDDRLQNYVEVRLSIIWLEFSIAVVVMGVVIDNYFISTNEEYKKWKKGKYSQTK